MIPRARLISQPRPRRSCSRCAGFTRGDWRSSIARIKTEGIGPADSSVIPGCASWRRPGIHTPDGGYGFRARSFCSRPGMTFLLLPRDDLGVGGEARQQRLQGGQGRTIRDAVDARRAEVALERGDHFHGRPVVFSVDRYAVTIFGERLLQVANVIADGA